MRQHGLDCLLPCHELEPHGGPIEIGQACSVEGAVPVPLAARQVPPPDAEGLEVGCQSVGDLGLGDDGDQTQRGHQPPPAKARASAA
jgi:hypothetical protein